MRIVTKRDVIRRVRERFIEQYRHYSDSEVIGPASSRQAAGIIRANLAALDLETCSEADVDAAIGVTGWASLECDECGTHVDAIARLGAEPDYEARWQDLCLECLNKALTALKGSPHD